MTEYEKAVVVTVTFKGDDRDDRARKLEAQARRLGGATFSEQVEVETDAVSREQS